jgi:hypothetical protein
MHVLSAQLFLYSQQSSVKKITDLPTEATTMYKLQRIKKVPSVTSTGNEAYIGMGSGPEKWRLD